MHKGFKVTRDSDVDMKRLRHLKDSCGIEIFDVQIDTVSKRTEKIPSIGVYGLSKYGESIYSSDATVLNGIVKIIGMNNIKDAMKLEGHIRNKNDYFITQDHDFLDKRIDLEKKFNIKILDITELENLCFKIRES